MKKRVSCLLLVLMLCLLCLAGCQSKEEANEEPEASKIQDLAESRIGLITGTMTALLTPEILPDAEYTEYNSAADVTMALMTGKIDAYPVDESLYLSLRWEGQNVERIDERLASSDYGMIFGKGENLELQAELNEFLARFREEGGLAEYEAKWFADSEPTEFLSYENLSGENGTLTVGICSSTKPFVYMKNGSYAGFDIELLILFAEEYGYKLDFEDTQFGSILTGVVMGSYDIGASGFTITEERAQSVDFTDVYHTEDLVMMIQGEAAADGDFWASMAESFEKTFIREDRWKLIVEGIGITILISVCAVLGGTVLGFLLYLAARAQNQTVSQLIKLLVKVYSKLIAGTPTLVILMLLFYVVFGKSDISGVMVAIIGFVLIFGSFVYEQLTLTVDGVDKGQTEAARALGYSRNQAFFRIILPQAMKMFVPVYSAEIVGLIKSTSVVGYIAVNDLTKMGDIIRSNTYEAFFPLIAVAVIYFMITWGAVMLLGILKRKTEPKRRKNRNILKGVVR